MPSTRAAKNKVITEDGEPVEDAVDALEGFDPEQLDEITIPESLVFASDEDAAEERKSDPGTPFEFDGQRYVAYRPKDAVMVTLMAAGSMNATMADQVQAVLEWLDHCLEPLAKMALKRRIYDRDDHLEWDDLARVMTGLLRHWEDEELTREERRSKQLREQRRQQLEAAQDSRARTASAGAAGRAPRTRSTRR